MMRPIHCGTCDSEHPAFLFSATERKNNDPTNRQCIGYEGRLLLCDHICLNWADHVTIDWDEHCESILGSEKPDRGEIRLSSCDHDSHYQAECDPQSRMFLAIEPHLELTIESRIRLNPREGLFLEGENEKQAYASQILDMFEAGALISCPHFKTTPYRIRRFDTHHRHGESFYSYACQVCQFRINIQLPEHNNDKRTSSQPYIECCNTTRPFLKNGAASENWVQVLDPDSYGHFSDRETKHITWCDDRQCATTFELLRATSLRWLFANQNVMKPLRADEALDQVTKRRIDVAFQPRQQQYLN